MLSGVNSQVIGKLALNAEIEVLEKTTIAQTIDGKTHYWYKIRHNDQTGYGWGGLIAVKTFTFSVNGYEIQDYYRNSYIEGRITGPDRPHDYYYPMILPDDIFININGRRIDTSMITEVYSEKYFTLHDAQRYYVRNDWHYTSFYAEGDIIQFSLTDSAASDSLFTLTIDGVIQYIRTDIGWL